MKKIIFAASAVAVFAATAGAASAAPVETTININAQVDSKCGISANASSIALGDITGANAKVKSTVTEDIAQKLTDAKVIAFCNAPNSTVKVERAVLARVGATGTSLTSGGFAQFVRYNLDTSINGLALDSTSTDGGTVVADRFGGHDSAGSTATHVQFAKAAVNGTAVASSNGSSETATNWSSLTDRRLAAGDYTGYVTVELTPAS
jgi:hypothetical protein